MMRKLFFNAIVLAVLGIAGAAHAQYTAPGMAGTASTSGVPTYTKKSYGVNKAAVGAALGGGVVGGALLMRHFRHRNTMTACVGSDGKTLDDGKNIYNVLDTTLSPNERLVIAGKRMKSDTGVPNVEVTAVRKDLGRCETPAISARK